MPDAVVVAVQKEQAIIGTKPVNRYIQHAEIGQIHRHAADDRGFFRAGHMKLVGHRAARRQIRERNLIPGGYQKYVRITPVGVCQLVSCINLSQRQGGVSAGQIADIGASSRRGCRSADDINVGDVTHQLAGLACVTAGARFIFAQRLFDVTALLQRFLDFYERGFLGAACKRDSVESAGNLRSLGRDLVVELLSQARL